MEVDLLRMALEQIPNRYELAVVAAERCKQLINGARPLVETKGDHPRKIALREIAEGKLVKVEGQYLPADAIDDSSLDAQPIQVDDGSGPSKE